MNLTSCQQKESVLQVHPTEQQFSSNWLTVFSAHIPICFHVWLQFPCASASCYTLLFPVWDDHHRNPNVNNRDHLVGQLTSILLYRWRTISSSTWQLRPSTRAVGEQSYHLKFFELSSVELHLGCRWTIIPSKTLCWVVKCSTALGT